MGNGIIPFLTKKKWDLTQWERDSVWLLGMGSMANASGS